MQETFTIVDTIQVAKCTFECKEMVLEKSFFDNLCSFSNIVIAIANIVLIYFIFRHNNKKNDTEIEKNRRQHLLKTLVLDCNMPKLYTFYANIQNVSCRLLSNHLSTDEKKIINENLKDSASEFRQDFIDLFIAIDENLYKNILSKVDELIDSLTNNIFDEGINLSYKPRFDEEVSIRIRESKSSIIGLLFSYTGN